MTVERRIIVGLEDIKTLAFQCKSCTAKFSYNPDTVSSVPFRCPACGHVWRAEEQAPYEPSEAAFVQLVKSISQIRTAIQKRTGVIGFRILFEFEEPKS